MAEEVYKLGDCEVTIQGSLIIITDLSGEEEQDFAVANPQPHELRKLAQAIEDHNRMRELGEDSNHIA